MKKVLAYLCIFVFTSGNAQTQLNSWFVNSQKFSMTQPIPTVTSFPMGSPFGGQPEYNSMCDNSGNLVFYILGNKLFNAANTQIGSLTPNSWMPETEIAIIPNPAHCNNKYFIVFCEVTPQLNPPVTQISYGTLDMNTSTYTYVGGLGLSNTAGTNNMAVSQVNANGERYLYFGGSSTVPVRICKVTSASISALNQSASPNIITNCGEMELSNAGDKLVFSRGTNPVMIEVVPLNPLTGLATGTPTIYNTGSNTICGLELDNTGNSLYVSQMNKGVVVQSLSNPSWAPSTPILGTAFDHTHLEKSNNGYWILCASSTSIRGIIASTATLDTWTLTLANPLPSTFVNFFPAIFMMPDQIDGENYNASFPVSPVSISILGNQTICNNASTTLQANGGNGATSYSWFPGGLAGTIVNVSPSVPTTYTLVASNGGCSATSTVSIDVVNCCTNPKPNSFTFDNVNLLAYGTPGALPWPAVPGYYTGNIALPLSGSVNGGNFSVWGTLTISSPVSFDNTDFAFNEAAGVTQYQPVTIDHSWWHACDKMWSGINSKNYLKITNSILEDASLAVSINFMTNHPGLLVDNTLFNRNNIGIAVAFAIVNTASPNNFRITGSIFTCKTLPASTYTFPLLSNYITSLISNSIVTGTFSNVVGSPVLGIPVKRSEYGIALALAQVTSGTFFNVGNSSNVPSQNSLETNYFDYLNAGIWNAAAKLYVVNGNFQEITTSSSNTAKGGIYHTGSSTSNTVTNVGDLNSASKQCVFGSSDIGINALGGGTMNVYGSTFNYLRDAIEVQKWYSPVYNGNPTGEVNILQNTFAFCNADLRAYDNFSIKAVMQGNTSTYGVSGAVINELAVSPTALYRIDGNSFARKNTVIFIGNTSNVNVTDNTIRLAPFTNSPEYGIYVFGSLDGLYSNNSISSNSAVNAGNPQVTGITCFQSAGNTFCSNYFSRVGDCMLFYGQCTPTNIFSNSFNASGGPAAQYAIHLVSANTGNIGVVSNATWYASDNLFGSFSNTNGNVSVYCESFSNIPMGRIYYNFSIPTCGNAPGSNSFSLSPTISIPGGALCPTATFRLRGDSLNVHPIITDSLNYIARKEMFYLAKMYPQYANILPSAVFNSCAISNIGRFYVMDSLVNDFITAGNHSSLATFENMNSMLVPVNTVEENQQQFNAIYYDYLSNDSMRMRGNVEALRTLAQKCPLTDGNAVFQARVLLKHFDPSDYRNSCEDVETPAPNSAGTVSASIAIYPNPASKEVYIKAGSDVSKVEIYSLLGVKLAAHVLAQGENRIDVSMLAPGNYFFKIYDTTGVIKVCKVIVQ